MTNANKKDFNLKYAKVLTGLDFSTQLKLFDIVVTHGGSGVTQQCIKHGVPMIILYSICDQ